jgi:hypothetical protein
MHAAWPVARPRSRPSSFLLVLASTLRRHEPRASPRCHVEAEVVRARAAVRGPPHSEEAAWGRHLRRRPRSKRPRRRGLSPGLDKLDSLDASTGLDRETRQLHVLNSSTATRRPGTCSQPRQARQELDRSSTGSTGKASTALRQRLNSRVSRLDSASRRSLNGASTARQLDSQGSIARIDHRGSLACATECKVGPQGVTD